MSDINKKFSLDWLAGKPEIGSRAPDIGASALDEAVKAYGSPIVKLLASAPGQEMRVHDLIQAVKPDSSFEEFLGVINRLSDLRLIEIKERDDRTGNHLIHLP